MKQQQFAIFLILTFSLVIIWVASNVYHTITTTTITPDLQKDILPISGTFDQSEITSILQRDQVVPQYTPNQVALLLPALPSVQPTATPSADQTVQPTQIPSQPISPSITPTTTGGVTR